MSKDAFTLSDIREPMLTIVCQPCGRRGRYVVFRLIEKHGDARLTDLLTTLTNSPRRSRATSTIGFSRHPIARKAKPREADEHHRPSRRLGDRLGIQGLGGRQAMQGHRDRRAIQQTAGFPVEHLLQSQQRLGE
jgi:hypothetical protein